MSNVRHAVSAVLSRLRAGPQRSPERARDEVLPVVLGLDFGTTCTRAVVRTPFARNGRAVAVDFGRLGHRSCSYLLPSVLSGTRTGGLRIGREAQEGAGEGLKRELMAAARQGLEEGPAVERAVAFLALAMQFSRAWFSETQARVFPGTSPSWSFNLGVPTDGSKEGKLDVLFLRVAHAAWSLSLSSSPVTLEAARRILAQPHLADLEEEFGVVPEVVAEVVGYARSTRRREGLHVLVDVGGTTLDIASFMLHRRDHFDVDRFSILTGDVDDSFGALSLWRRVAETLSSAGCEVPVVPADPVAPLPSFSEVLGGRLEDASLTHRIQVAEVNFAKDCSSTFVRTVHTLRTRRAPTDPNWRRLPVFLAGGGLSLEAYREALHQAFSRFRRNFQIGEPEVTALPRPDYDVLANEDIDEQLYPRLAVAFGLSFDKPDIGEITSPREIADLRSTGQRRPFWEDYPDNSVT
jgi:hypothetical protein